MIISRIQQQTCTMLGQPCHCLPMLRRRDPHRDVLLIARAPPRYAHQWNSHRHIAFAYTDFDLSYKDLLQTNNTLYTISRY